ncbi:MAG: cytochrome C [Bacteriovoracaceae bacterium]
MKEFVNYMADPIRSFPIFTLMFWWMFKYVRVFGSKAFAKWTTIASIPVIVWFCADPNFIKIILWPDNIPIIILLFAIAFFTWFSLHKAVENDKRIEAGEVPIEATPENREKVWCWPNLVYTELFAIIAGTVFLVVWAIVFKAPLEEPANPTWAPNPAKAPWYFLGLQEMLVYFDPWMAGVVLPGLIVVGLIAIPYIDTNPKGNGYYSFKERKLAMFLFLYGWLVLWFYLILVGTFLRGPNWTFYGPFEYWDFHKVVAEYNVNLSEFLWIKGLNMAMPSNMIVRELLGIILSLAYIVLIPLYIGMKTKWGKDLIGKVGNIRFYIMIFLAVTMASLPIKMVLRWLFGLKYIVALPELELNL